jgi:hypothetical protein
VRVRARGLSAAAFVRAGGAIRDSDYPLKPSHAPLSVQRRVLFHHPTSKLSDTSSTVCKNNKLRQLGVQLSRCPWCSYI